MVMSFQQRQEKASDRVKTEVGGDIADAQPAIRVGIVGVGLFESAERHDMALVPLPMFLGKHSSRCARVKVQGVDQIAVRRHIARPHCHSPAITGNRLVEFSLVFEGIAQVVMGLGIVRVQFQCPPVISECVVKFSLVAESDAQVVVSFGIVRL